MKRTNQDDGDGAAPRMPRAHMVECWLAFLRRHASTDDDEDNDVFVAGADADDARLTRAEEASKHKKPGKGHEIPIDRVENELQPLVDEAMEKQWKLWVDTGSVRRRPPRRRKA